LNWITASLASRLTPIRRTGRLVELPLNAAC